MGCALPGAFPLIARLPFSYTLAISPLSSPCVDSIEPFAAHSVADDRGFTTMRRDMIRKPPGNGTYFDRGIRAWSA